MKFRFFPENFSLLSAFGISIIFHAFLLSWLSQFDEEKLTSNRPLNSSRSISIVVLPSLSNHAELTPKSVPVDPSKTSRLESSNISHPKSRGDSSQHGDANTLNSSFPNKQQRVDYSFKTSSTHSVNEHKGDIHNKRKQTIEAQVRAKQTLPSKSINSPPKLYPSQPPHQSVHSASPASSVDSHDHEASSKAQVKSDLVPNNQTPFIKEQANKPKSVAIKKKQIVPKVSEEVVINETPRCKRCVEPSYPPTALRRGKQGLVIVRVMVASSGRVVSANLISSSGDSSLDAAALKAASSSSFHSMSSSNSRVIHYDMNIEIR